MMELTRCLNDLQWPKKSMHDNWRMISADVLRLAANKKQWVYCEKKSIYNKNIKKETNNPECIRFVNGNLQTTDFAKSSAVKIVAMSDLLDHPQAAAAWENSISDDRIKNKARTSHAFAQVQAACTQDGVVIIVEDNTSVEQLIHIKIESTEECYQAPRLVFCIGENSKARVKISYVLSEELVNPSSSDCIVWINSMISFNCSENSNVEVMDNINNARAMALTSHYLVKQEKQSNWSSILVSNDVKFSRHDVQVDLSGDDAHCSVAGLMIAEQNQQIQQQLLINHLADRTSSKQLIKGTAEKNSEIAFCGKVFIDKNVRDINAEQRSDHLLLHPTARACQQPQLEIISDQVSCSHGATVGQLDDRALFYLQSRGLSLKDARQVLIDGFIKSWLDQQPEFWHSDLASDLYSNFHHCLSFDGAVKDNI